VLRRFYRSDKVRSTPGVGLGLNLVAAIVKLHGFVSRSIPARAAGWRSFVPTGKIEKRGPGLAITMFMFAKWAATAFGGDAGRRAFVSAFRRLNRT